MDANGGTPRSHLVGFYGDGPRHSRPENVSEPLAPVLHARLDEMATMMRSQQAALTKFAKDNESLRATIEEMKEETGTMHKEIIELKSTEETSTAGGNSGECHRDTTLAVSFLSGALTNCGWICKNPNHH